MLAENVAYIRVDGRCVNCGTAEFLSYRQIVPEALGGTDTDSNYVLLCRACEISAAFDTKKSGNCRPVTVYLSRQLFEMVIRTPVICRGSASLSSLARKLVAAYIASPERYSNVMMYQDRGTDVRTNLWLDHAVYKRFKETTYVNGATVSDALSCLLYHYASTVSQQSESGL